MRSAIDCFSAADLITEYQRELSSYFDMRDRMPWFFGRKAHKAALVEKRRRMEGLVDSVAALVGTGDPGALALARSLEYVK
jgi:hypothetical protein